MDLLAKLTDLSYRYFHPKTFVFQGKAYEYFDHPYNTTRFNERSVEVPIILDLVSQYEGKNILEVGNVLSHYVDIPHDIVDKYEIAEGVVNDDIVDFSPKKKYDLIVSISTFEHVGWDEFPRDATKIPKSLKHLSTLLKKGGMCVFTVPVDINDFLDMALHDHSLPITSMKCLKRVSRSNIWEEKSWEQVKHAWYDYPFPNANAIVVGTIQK